MFEIITIMRIDPFYFPIKSNNLESCNIFMVLDRQVSFKQILFLRLNKILIFDRQGYLELL